MNRFNSVKLIPHDSIDLDRLSYSNGDLVFDVTLGTIRLMDDSTLGGSKIATQGWVSLNYTTSVGLTSTLANYVTTSAQTTALSTALSGYVTSSALTTALTSYVTTSAQTTALSSYATTASLSSYATTASLSSYATNTNLALKANIASPTFSGTVTTPTAIIGGVNIKAFAIAMGAGLA